MNKLYKQCGKEMTVNDKSLAHALSIGWTVKNPIRKKSPEKKTNKKAD